MIISNFEDKLAAYVALTAFIPMLMEQAVIRAGRPRL